MNRESFVFHRDWYNAISQLDNDLRLKLYDAVMRKAFFNEPPRLSQMGNLAMSFIEPQIERDLDKWLDIREKRSIAGKKHTGNQHIRKLEQMEQVLSNGTNDNKMEQNGTNGTVSVTVSDSVSVDNNNVVLKEKEDTDVLKKKEKPLWVESYEEYVKLIDDALGCLFVDEEYKSQQEILYVNIDYQRTLVACANYWKQKEQWESYKRKKIKKPNFISAIKNGFHINKIYKSRQFSNDGYPQSVDDMKEEDVQTKLDFFNYWIEKKAPNVCDGLSKGRPQTEPQYQSLIEHTEGGARALCYVVLVLNRDGWEQYADERGFMWVYSNYIKANGLYKG